MCWPILYTPAIQWWPKYVMQLVCFAFCALPAYNFFPVVEATVLFYFLRLVHLQPVPEKQYEETRSYRAVFTKHTLILYAWLCTSLCFLECSLAQDMTPTESFATIERNTSPLIYATRKHMHLSFLSLKHSSFIHLQHKTEWECLCIAKQDRKEVAVEGVGIGFGLSPERFFRPIECLSSHFRNPIISVLTDVREECL